MAELFMSSVATSVADRWLGSSVDEVVMSTVAVFAAVIGLTRLVGLRSFSQMSSFDFAMTVAIGSVVAGTASSPSTSLVEGVVALVVLYGVQLVISWARVRWHASAAVDNTPLLLMHDGEVLEDNLRAARLTHQDLWAKLRTQGVADPGDVRAAVFETTADVSVITGPGALDPRLLDGVRGVPGQLGCGPRNPGSS